MTSNTMDKSPVEVSLETRILGASKFTPFSSVSDAADHAISLITSGEAIPKSIKLNGEVVMSESDINLYWEQS